MMILGSMTGDWEKRNERQEASSLLVGVRIWKATLTVASGSTISSTPYFRDLRMTTRYAHLSQAHLQEAVRLLEGGSEEAGGYNTATTSVLAGTGRD